MEIRKMRTGSISLKATRFMLPRRQQTEATVEILDGNWCPPPIFLIILALVEIFDYFYQAHVCGWTQECVPDYLFMINFERTLQLWRPFTFFLYHLRWYHPGSSAKVHISALSICLGTSSVNSSLVRRWSSCIAGASSLSSWFVSPQTVIPKRHISVVPLAGLG